MGRVSRLHLLFVLVTSGLSGLLVAADFIQLNDFLAFASSLEKLSTSADLILMPAAHLL